MKQCNLQLTFDNMQQRAQARFTGDNNTMKKIKKNQKNAYTRNDIELPAVVDMESLSYVSDDDLDRRHSYLLGERERAVRLECDSRPWDTEICYVQRELKIRTDRRVAHERYLRTNPESHFFSQQTDEMGVN